MLSRVKLILPVALVLLASGQFVNAATYTYVGSSASFSTLEAACLGYGKALVAASNGSFTSVRFVSASLADTPALAAQNFYTCKNELFSAELKDWIESSGAAQEIIKCEVGQSQHLRGPTSSAIYSPKQKSYIIASRPLKGAFKDVHLNRRLERQAVVFWSRALRLKVIAIII